jgi:hypothetical protein
MLPRLSPVIAGDPQGTSGEPALLRFDVGRVDHFAPLFGFLGDELARHRALITSSESSRGGTRRSPTQIPDASDSVRDAG